MPRQLLPMRLGLAEYKRNTWCVYPENGVTFEEVMNPDFWSHVAKQMKPGDRVEVWAEDGTWWAELLVRDTRALAVLMGVISKIDFKSAREPKKNAKPPYYVDWKGPHRKFAVVRDADNEVIKDGFAVKDDAELYAREHEKALAV